jgi:hypothetical protein
MNGKSLMLGTLVAAASALCLAAEEQGQHGISVGIREHSDRKPKDISQYYPFETGHLSYCAAYEYHAEVAYWQVAVDWSPLPGVEAASYSITPQINLIFKDRFYRGGFGLLRTYSSGKWEPTEESEGEEVGKWTPFYWQFILGVSIPLPGRFALDVFGFYPFRKFKHLDDFEWDDFELGAWVSFVF